MEPLPSLPKNLDVENVKQVVSKLILEEPLSHLNQKEWTFSISPQNGGVKSSEHVLQNVTLKDSLSMTLEENGERRYFIIIPSKTLRVVINVRVYPFTLIYMYTILIIPTLKEEDIPMGKGPSHTLLTHLEMSLKQDARSTMPVDSRMKVLLWNCRGCNNPDFKRIFKSIVEWNNPSIICLTETIM
ncbi:hypothetical protein RND71_039427 [Anisodus tanguticus]|uniref:Endonuclease/exonuclease/phosphatase domain-containing protein n=1 Tax=Anisodus tanguticus TaxID=243964 RepID=A0AAE1QWY3_9SOLA|nr:hypothetical protein RND71_039427 [Anisodus tanguticus]